MKNRSSPGWRARVLATLFGLSYAPSLLAESLPYIGQWIPEAQASSDWTLTIKDTSMSWRGPAASAPGCVQAFELKKEKPGTVYIDGRGFRFVAGSLGSLPTYLFKLGPNTCGGPADQVRISFPLVYDTQHIELIEYAGGKPLTVRRLHRKK
jgi:hypothetical protein